MRKVIIKTPEGAHLAVLFVEGEVIVKERNGVQVEVGEEENAPCKHSNAIQGSVAGLMFCPDCDRQLPWPQDD